MNAADTRPLLLGLLLGFMPLLVLHSAPGEGQTLWREDEQRVRVGLKLFPACVGALEAIETWLTPRGSLLVLVVYTGSSASTRPVVANLESVERIRDYPLEIRAVSAAELDAYSGPRPVGVFVSSVDLPPRQQRLWSERYRTLVFSPFAGAVEGGAVAGIYVADRVLPFVSPTQARRAGIRFKPFFLDVARLHDGH
ncbi:hypothetical protein GJ668_02320 [Allochromatium palmeri]|uniref:DUF4154 domain-containing protein n=2 Tax=Allochromatium palmeri TaxID=231048 RepID=A0A6N8E724_9GAMM|nr:hypothetical protein [Allochromatium palmeri]MTW19925.1 hypothetical protein [Allochromatium palmeri]